ncbi:MAG: hypothetical protein GY910_02275 [bacterium]|nr:hypothetical protein [Deltaproteobacteria bacterium]MCP4903781.1 hypothetical protein [bacterium]
MSKRLRRILAAMGTFLMFSTAFAPTAMAATSVDQSDAANAPAVVDALVLRPAGFISLVVGVTLFAVSAPIVLITRPFEIGIPFKQLVVRPAKYIWVDPIGGH